MDGLNDTPPYGIPSDEVVQMSMFDDERDIHILHGDYMDTYFPFYYGDSERNLFGDYTLYKTITNYNKKMDALVSKGIFFPKGMSLDSSFRKR